MVDGFAGALLAVGAGFAGDVVEAAGGAFDDGAFPTSIVGSSASTGLLGAGDFLAGLSGAAEEATAAVRASVRIVSLVIPKLVAKGKSRARGHVRYPS